MKDLSELSLNIGSLQAHYRSGSLTPSDVIREVYRRIRTLPDIPIWIHLIPEEDAMRAAEALPGSASSPVFGIPFAIKDNIDAANLPTTAGCPMFSYVAEHDATTVGHLKKAGGILIGKTNLDQFATGLVGARSPYGACSTVFHPEYISGGSSSGSAVAVAAGLVSFALGTDTAGSGGIQQHCRPEADQGHFKYPWRGAGLPIPRLCLTLVPDGGRRSNGIFNRCR